MIGFRFGNKSKMHNTSTYKHKGHGIDAAVVKVIEPIFDDLTKDDLLLGCIDA